MKRLDKYTEKKKVSKDKTLPERIFKAFETEWKADGETVIFTISTGTVDRDNDTVNPGGWNLQNYLKNPVVLWAHDYTQLPVGKCTNIGVTGDKLSATVEFADHAFAQTVKDLVKGGFLNATSVGFKPMEYTINETRQGLDFTSQELLEFSIVPIPSNPQALIEARAAGVNLDPMLAWAKSVMTMAPEAPMARKAVPPDPNSKKADEGTAWNAPALKDFTDSSWDDLSDGERRRIARHFSYAESIPPKSFGELKLPHHRPEDGAVVWRGVANAAARLNQSSIPSNELGAVQAHLAHHYQQFQKEPPWKRAPEAWTKYQARLAGKECDGWMACDLAATLRVAGLDDEAVALSMSICPRDGCPKDPMEYWCQAEDCPLESAANSGTHPPASDGQPKAPASAEETDLIVIDSIDQANGEPVMFILASDEPETFSSEEIAAALQAAMTTTMTALASEATEAALRAMRGRID